MMILTFFLKEEGRLLRSEFPRIQSESVAGRGGNEGQVGIAVFGDLLPGTSRSLKTAVLRDR